MIKQYELCAESAESDRERLQKKYAAMNGADQRQGNEQVRQNNPPDPS